MEKFSIYDEDFEDSYNKNKKHLEEDLLINVSYESKENFNDIQLIDSIYDMCAKNAAGFSFSEFLYYQRIGNVSNIHTPLSEIFEAYKYICSICISNFTYLKQELERKFKYEVDDAMKTIGDYINHYNNMMNTEKIDSIEKNKNIYSIILFSLHHILSYENKPTENILYYLELYQICENIKKFNLLKYKEIDDMVKFHCIVKALYTLENLSSEYIDFYELYITEDNIDKEIKLSTIQNKVDKVIKLSTIQNKVDKVIKDDNEYKKITKVFNKIYKNEYYYQKSLISIKSDLITKYQDKKIKNFLPHFTYIIMKNNTKFGIFKIEKLIDKLSDNTYDIYENSNLLIRFENFHLYTKKKFKDSPKMIFANFDDKATAILYNYKIELAFHYNLISKFSDKFYIINKKQKDKLLFFEKEYNFFKNNILSEEKNNISSEEKNNIILKLIEYLSLLPNAYSRIELFDFLTEELIEIENTYILNDKYLYNINKINEYNKHKGLEFYDILNEKHFKDHVPYEPNFFKIFFDNLYYLKNISFPIFENTFFTTLYEYTKKNNNYKNEKEYAIKLLRNYINNVYKDKELVKFGLNSTNANIPINQKKFWENLLKQENINSDIIQKVYDFDFIFNNYYNSHDPLNYALTSYNTLNGDLNNKLNSLKNKNNQELIKFYRQQQTSITTIKNYIDKISEKEVNQNDTQNNNTDPVMTHTY